MRKLKVVWDNEAKKQLRQLFNYIKEDSLQNAEKVRNAIVASTKALSKNPEINPPDKYRLNNNGSYRAYELFRYRIAYHISEEQITIVRVRHTSMEPTLY